MPKTKKIKAGWYETLDGAYLIVSVEAWTEGLDSGGWHLFAKPELDAGRDGYCNTFATKADALDSLTH